MSIMEVAKLAGCSHTSVSRVINQKPNVSPAIASKVEAAMAELSYVPPIKRRGPQPKDPRAIRTGNIALLMFGEQDAALRIAPVAGTVIAAVENALGDHGFTLTWGQVKSEQRIPPVVARGEVDGLILLGKAPSPELADRLRRFPSVWVMSPRSYRGFWGDRVCPDSTELGRLAADYLTERGHRKLAYLGVDGAHLGFRDRCESFVEHAEATGASVDLIDNPSHRQKYGLGDFAGERRFIEQLVERFAALEDRPSGLFIPRGQTVFMVCDALRAKGIEPGPDVTLIACDHDPALAALAPPIATLDVRPARIGQAAVELLVHRLQQPPSAAPRNRTTLFIRPELLYPEASGLG